LGQAEQSEFGNYVCRPGFGAALPGRIGNNVDDRSRAALTHGGQKSLEAKVGAGEVGLDQLTIFLERQFAETAGGSVSPGGINEYLDLSEGLGDSFGHGGDELRVTDVARIDEHARRTFARERHRFFESV